MNLSYDINLAILKDINDATYRNMRSVRHQVTFHVEDSTREIQSLFDLKRH